MRGQGAKVARRTGAELPGVVDRHADRVARRPAIGDRAVDRFEGRHDRRQVQAVGRQAAWRRTVPEGCPLPSQQVTELCVTERARIGCEFRGQSGCAPSGAESAEGWLESPLYLSCTLLPGQGNVADDISFAERAHH